MHNLSTDTIMSKAATSHHGNNDAAPQSGNVTQYIPRCGTTSKNILAK